jgi:acyl dehydratase
MTWKFLGPVMVGDTLKVRWWIKEKRPTSKPGRGVIVREIQVLNQNDAIVCTGEMTSLWSMRTPA